MRHKSLMLNALYHHPTYKPLLLDNPKLGEIQDPVARQFLDAVLLPLANVYGAERFYGREALTQQLTKQTFLASLQGLGLRWIAEGVAIILNGGRPELLEHPPNPMQLHKVCRDVIPEAAHQYFEPTSHLRLETDLGSGKPQPAERQARADNYLHKIRQALGTAFVDVSPKGQTRAYKTPLTKTQNDWEEQEGKKHGKTINGPEAFLDHMEEVFSKRPGEKDFAPAFYHILDEYRRAPRQS